MSGDITNQKSRSMHVVLTGLLAGNVLRTWTFEVQKLYTDRLNIAIYSLKLTEYVLIWHYYNVLIGEF